MDEERRSARLEPVVAELQLVKGIQQAERVIDANTAIAEMVAVIHQAQLLAHSLISDTLTLCKTVQGLFKILVDFRLRYAADVYIAAVH